MYKYTNYEIHKILTTYVILYLNNRVHNVHTYKTCLDYLNHMDKVEDRPVKLINLLITIHKQTSIVIEF